MKEFYEFYYNLSSAYFIADEDCMYMDRNKFVLSAKTKQAQGDIMVPVKDVRKIYAPYMSASVGGGKAVMEMDDNIAEVTAGSNKIKINGAEKVMKNTCVCEDGILYIPVGEVMTMAFDKYKATNMDEGLGLDERTWGRKNLLMCVCNKYEYKEVPGKYIVEKKSRDQFEFDKAVVTGINAELNGKAYGELYKTYWFAEADKIMTYSAYIPTKYDPNIATKLVVQLHGGGLGEQFIYSLSKNMVQFWSERFNYVFIAPNACTRNSTYGNLMTPGPVGDLIADENNPANPYGFSEEEIVRRKLGEKGVLEAVKAISAEYNVDQEHIFLMGNSMGGLGTFHLGSTYPQIFRAIAPFGIGLDPRFIKYFDLKYKPIRMVGGTEDPGFPRIMESYKYFKRAGYDVELDVVGGGVHYDSWSYVLEDTFKFFEKNS